MFLTTVLLVAVHLIIYAVCQQPATTWQHVYVYHYQVFTMQSTTITTDAASTIKGISALKSSSDLISFPSARTSGNTNRRLLPDVGCDKYSHRRGLASTTLNAGAIEASWWTGQALIVFFRFISIICI
ncbi:hypothetical protein NPIL_250881 [Nephila pilipes]|uniref:Secreted protein n=1 Tax=Nephila pilipes TaxID=299642 RepID=A0A8X6PFM4_NEPPI|nr:hypothetical protein NPIL_250881 [Nephila pilipes]